MKDWSEGLSSCQIVLPFGGRSVGHLENGRILPKTDSRYPDHADTATARAACAICREEPPRSREDTFTSTVDGAAAHARWRGEEVYHPREHV